MEEIVQEQLLEIKHLEKSYGEDSPVLKDISLSVKKGEVVVLLGPSGAYEGAGQKEGGGCAGSPGAFGQSPSFR